MDLNLFKTLWGHKGSFAEACELAVEAGFQGIEGQAPADSDSQKAWCDLFGERSLQYIAEVVTGGDYVPAFGCSPDEHLDDLKRGLDTSMPLDPLFVTTMCGADSWDFEDVIRFYEELMELGKAYDVLISVETHRSRSTFNPWQTRRILEALPEIKFTVDFSHWCVVTERLVIDEEPELLNMLAKQCHHIHGRVGYPQGPQVPHPRAPEYAEELAAHTCWWQAIVKQFREAGRTEFTVTPEFGADGYLQSAPFTQQPVADLWEVNRWMGDYLREVEW